MSLTSGLIHIVGKGRGWRESCIQPARNGSSKYGVAEGVHKFTRRIAADLRQHQREQGIGGDVERHAQEDVGAALVELAGKLAIGDVELEQAMAGWQRHVVDIARIPGRNDMAARIRVVLQAVHELR
jgi:hypothetical protein